MSKGDMYAGAVLTGIAEGFFEKYSLDKIIKMKPGGVKNIIINALKSAGIEASEEMVTEFADIVIDNAVANSNSENNLEKARLIREEGLSKEEAERKVFVDNCSSVIWSGVGGGLAGFGFGGISGAVNAVSDTELSDVDNEEEIINAIAESLAYKEQLKREPMKSNAQMAVDYLFKRWAERNGYSDEGQIDNSLTRKEKLKNYPMKSNAQMAVDFLVDKWARKNGYSEDGIDDFGDINSQDNSYVDSQLNSSVSDSIIENSVEPMLENPEDSGIIKNIELNDIESAIANGSINKEVAKTIYDTLNETQNNSLFDNVVTVKLDSKIVMQTDPIKKGTFFNTTLNLNENFLGGKTVEQIDEEIKNSKKSVANSLKEAVIHEKYHAKLINGLNQGQLEALYDVLSEYSIEGISPTAYIDGAECIAELGVLYERGEIENIPKEAVELFNQYMGDLL